MPDESFDIAGLLEAVDWLSTRLPISNRDSSTQELVSRAISPATMADKSLLCAPRSRFRFFQRRRTKQQARISCDPACLTPAQRLLKVDIAAEVTPESLLLHVRLCESPGGHANLQLAIPVPIVKPAHRSSFSLGSWDNNNALSKSVGTPIEMIENEIMSDDTLLAATPILDDTNAVDAVDYVDMVDIDPLLAVTIGAPIIRCRDLQPDVRTVCAPIFLCDARCYIHQIVHLHSLQIRATKWACYFLQLISEALHSHRVSLPDAISLRWVVCAYARREWDRHARRQLAKQAHFQRTMTDYRVAMQCICGTSVLKFGRKGKPHVTHLMIENGDTFRWTSKMLTGASTSRKHKTIALVSIRDVRAGPTTDVLRRALIKHTLRLEDAKCTLSLITSKRTFDLKTRDTTEREWLHRSFQFLIALAHEQEQRVARQVELSIMTRMSLLRVWKHGRKGRPHKTHLSINRLGELSWQSRSGGMLQLEEITTLERGLETPVFTRSSSLRYITPGASPRCFSIVTKTRTLDIETESEQQRDWFVVALQYLMDKVQEKTVAMQRENAQKQLRVLREMLGSNLAQLALPHQSSLA